MTINDVGVFTRVTSEQVDDILMDGSSIPMAVIDDICRDWLDMADRIVAAERVVAAARSCYSVVDYPEERLVAAIEAYDALAAHLRGGE